MVNCGDITSYLFVAFSSGAKWREENKLLIITRSTIHHYMVNVQGTSIQ